MNPHELPHKVEAPLVSDLLIITGPPGAGKSTVARLVADRFEPSALVLGDAFFGFVARGYIDPWLPESHEQNTVVMRIVARAAAGYADAGYFTVIDGIVSPRWFYAPLRDWLREAGHEVAYAVLRASLPACIARASDRDAHRLADAAVIEQLWHDFADLGDLDRHAIETDGMSAGEAAELLATRLRDGSLTASR